MRLLVAVALALTVAPSSTAKRVDIRFSPESESFTAAAREYRDLWELEGSTIIAVMEHVSGLKFPENEIEVVVYEGPSWSASAGAPMRMRASYPEATKKATLIHELGHRHLAQLRRRPEGLDEHRVLFLFLYDVWDALYGKEFADEQVEVEKHRRGFYDYEVAWVWALAQKQVERANRFREIVEANRSGR